VSTTTPTSLKAADLNRWKKAFDLLDSGAGAAEAARKSRLSPSTVYRFLRGDPASGGLEAAARLGRAMVGGNLVAQPLADDAQRALADFAFFRLRYMGRRSTPWQVRAAYEALRAIERGKTDSRRQFLVINTPPGVGKSTLFTHDLPCWLIARDRTIRIQIGSRTERQARMYVNRIRKTLEREGPMRADADSLALGHAFDATATMLDDFGEFKPAGRAEMWRAEALTVRQVDGVALDDKEATVTAWGQDSGFLGSRFDFIMWDDLVDRKNTKTTESQASIREWWSTEAETRVEPQGVLILQGQRIAHSDLYRYCLDMTNLDETPKYRHIVYPAHHDEMCQGEHEDVKAWPNGCLLDPYRLPWQELERTKHNNVRVFQVQYQQSDGDLAGGLVDPAWISGGTDAEGYQAPGCLDSDRPMGVVPFHLRDGVGFSYVTVDPSPTEWWGIIWWCYDPSSQNRYIVDIARRKMNPEDFLSLDLDTFAYSGLCEHWRLRANDLGAPITHIIVEVNAAQRWLLTQPHIQRWMEATRVVFIPHTTTINRADPKFGLESIGDLFRQGKIRIPHSDPASRIKAEPLIREAINYPDSETDDLLMSTWFGKLAVENLWSPRQHAPIRMPRPGYLTSTRRGLTWAR
jgi:hypothetical protein